MLEMVWLLANLVVYIYFKYDVVVITFELEIECKPIYDDPREHP